MTVSQERFANPFIVELLTEYVGRNGVSVEEAAGIMDISVSRLRQIMRGDTYMRVVELVNLTADPRFHSMLADLLRPNGYVVKRPVRLNNPCPKHLTTLSAQATSVNAAASEDGIVDHTEMPDVANANRRHAEYYYSWLVSQ